MVAANKRDTSRLGLPPKVAVVPAPTCSLVLLLLSDTHFFDAGRQFCADLGIADILVRQFADEVEHLLRRGLTQRYVRRSDDLSFPRGRIDFNTMARQLAAVRRITIDSGLH